MENKKVMIENCVNHEVGIVLPELGIRRTWERKGAKKIFYQKKMKMK